MRPGNLFVIALLAACGSKNPGGGDGGGDDGPSTPDACVGLECQVVDCNAMQKPPTSISGTVFAPNGTLPLFGINVYVPREDPPAFTDGVKCETCAAGLPGNPIVSTVSDDAGKFTLTNVPAGDNIQLVITTGKWRRKVMLPHVEACTDTPITAAQTSLPKTKVEGDIPKIALTTGGADSMECLVRKLGIADSEITISGGPGRVHFYAGSGAGVVTKFKAGFAGGASGSNFTSATPFWSTIDGLKPYDIVLLSCEGDQTPNTKPQAALNAMKAYADMGGRVFASHWHNMWIGGGFQHGNPQTPPVWSSIATWQDSPQPGLTDIIDEVANPKGMSFANWMLNVMGSTTRGQIQLQNNTDRSTCTRVEPAKAERWTYAQSNMNPQNFQFTTPNEQAADTRCGKVVFTDMHVSGGPGNGDFPDSCGGSTTLTPQEKALAFMFFDIASCVGVIP